jgi:hypothetical protein
MSLDAGIILSVIAGLHDIQYRHYANNTNGMKYERVFVKEKVTK